MSHRPALSQVARGVRSFATAALVLVQPVMSALLLMPQPAHADVASGDIVFTQAQYPGGTYTIMKRSSDGTETPLAGVSGAPALAFSPEQPDVSTDGSRIVFMDPRACLNDTSSSRATLIMMSSDGSGETPLTSPDCPTNESIEDTNPFWSPDGTQIAFSHQHNITTLPGEFSSRIYKINPGTGAETPVTTTDNEYDAPSWSPANDRIVYDSIDPATGGFQLYIVNADGTNPHLLAGSNSGYADSHPVWSHGGNRIYFVSSGGLFGNYWYYESTDGFTTTTNVTRHQISSDAVNPLPEYDLSADDSSLVFVQGDRSDGYLGCRQLWSMTTAGASLTQLTHDACSTTEESSAAFTPSVVDNAWPKASTRNLVALGDSVAAGEGINYGYVWNGSGWDRNGPANPDWMTTTPATDSDYEVCHQSGKGYPDQLRLNGDNYSVRNMACTGAAAGTGIMNNQDSKVDPDDSSTTDVTAQLDYATGNKFDAHDADVVTLTVGADDVDFVHWIKVCYDPGLGACNTSANTTELNTRLSNQKTNLRTVLSELDSRANAASKTLRVLVTNYFDPFPSNGSGCVDVDGGSLLTTYPTIGISGSEKTWIENGLVDLNGNVNSEVSYAKGHDSHLDVSLVDISNVMSGHEFCTSDPWVYGTSIDFPLVNGSLLPGNNPAPFHPTVTGQHAIYDAVKRVLNGNGDFVTNGTFESGSASGWSNGGSTPNVSTTVAHSGSKSMTFTGSFDATDSPNFITAAMPVDVDPVDFWAKGPSGKTIRVKFRQYLTGGNNELYQSFTLTGGWDHFTSKALHLYPGYALDLNFDNPGAGSGDVYYLDDIHEYGYTATETCGYDNLLNGLNADAIENCGGEAPYGIQFWAAADSANPTLTSDTDDTHDGLYSFKLVAANSGTMSMNDSPDARDVGEVSTSATSCTATAWMKGPSTAGSRVLKVRIREYNANQGGLMGTVTATATPNGSWQQLSITRTLASGHDANTHLDLYAYMTNASANDVVRVDHLTETCQ